MGSKGPFGPWNGRFRGSLRHGRRHTRLRTGGGLLNLHEKGPDGVVFLPRHAQREGQTLQHYSQSLLKVTSTQTICMYSICICTSRYTPCIYICDFKNRDHIDRTPWLAGFECILLVSPGKGQVCGLRSMWSRFSPLQHVLGAKQSGTRRTPEFHPAT